MCKRLQGRAWRGLFSVWALLLLALGNGARAALPDEIQVYVDDLNEPGRLSVQLHVNATPSGVSTPDYPGESVAAHGWRMTPEFAYGLTPTLEAGAYLPVVHEDGVLRAAGVKLRLKWVPVRPPEDGAGFFAGLNGELSQVQQRFEEDTRGLELRPIFGWRNERWLLATNPVLEIALSGPDRNHAPGFSPSFKVARTVAQGVQAGLEYYADAGTVADPLLSAPEHQTLYWAIDIDRKPWVINFGIGRGFNSDTDRWTVKLIVDIPLGR